MQPDRKSPKEIICRENAAIKPGTIGNGRKIIFDENTLKSFAIDWRLPRLSLNKGDSASLLVLVVISRG
jgi:hypothetical protein